tara:strand:- start:171 stop:353 length:183 start_codon:yes stop_codon:yes gene_type:complete
LGWIEFLDASATAVECLGEGGEIVLPPAGQRLKAAERYQQVGSFLCGRTGGDQQGSEQDC